MDLQQILLALAAFIGGGLSGFIRARGQNKTDDRVSLSEAEARLREHQFRELEAARTELKVLREANNTYVRDAADQLAHIKILLNEIDEVKNDNKRCDEVVKHLEDRIEQLAAFILKLNLEVPQDRRKRPV